MKRGTPQHPKMLMLAAELNVPKYAAVGIMESLWHWAAQYAKRGDIGRYPDRLIAEAIEWKGDPTALMDALVNARWLDRDETHRLLVHDWPAHADDTVHVFLARGLTRFADGSIPMMARLSKDERALLLRQFESQVHSVATKSTQETHCLSQSQSLSQSHSNPPLPPKGGGAGEKSKPEPEGFLRFWAAWPKHERKTNRKTCLKRWNSAPLEPLTEEILRGLNRWKASARWAEQAGRFIPAPLVWLNQERWTAADALDPAEREQGDNGFVRAPITREVALAIGMPWPEDGSEVPS